MAVSQHWCANKPARNCLALVGTRTWRFKSFDSKLLAEICYYSDILSSFYGWAASLSVSAAVYDFTSHSNELLNWTVYDSRQECSALQDLVQVKVPRLGDRLHYSFSYSCKKCQNWKCRVRYVVIIPQQVIYAVRKYWRFELVIQSWL